MRGRMTIIIIGIMACIVAALWLPGTGYAQDATPTRDVSIVIPESINVRARPGDAYVSVGALYAGERVFPLNISADGRWVLVPYNRGFGWVERSLVSWSDTIILDELPVLLPDVTPTRSGPETATPFFPTATPEGNYVEVEAGSALVRAGPGQGYLRLGQLLPGETVTPVARNEDTSWVMIRYEDQFMDGFGWVARQLIEWEDEIGLITLPEVDEDNLTPTATFTPSQTPQPSMTPTYTATSTGTVTSTYTATVTPTATPTATHTASATATVASAPTDTATPTFTSTATVTPTPTVTATPTFTSTATVTPTFTPTVTATVSPTRAASSTATPTETVTPSPQPTSIATMTMTSTALPTATQTETPLPSATVTATHTVTATATMTATATFTATHTATATVTPIPALSVVTPSIAAPVESSTEVAAVSAATIERTPDVSVTVSTAELVTATSTETDTAGIILLPETPTPLPTDENEPLLPAPSDADVTTTPSIEAIIGGIALLVVLMYVGLFVRGSAAAARYQDGFVIDRCPVCQRGELHLDERIDTTFGIPLVRRIVRCDECRSVLREKGTRRWRYAVDRIENPLLYERLNNRLLTDDELEKLAENPIRSYSAGDVPEFIDDTPDDDL